MDGREVISVAAPYLDHLLLEMDLGEVTYGRLVTQMHWGGGINLRGEGRLERALLGSTAERVIRAATVPVLSLPLPVTYAARWAAA